MAPTLFHGLEALGVPVVCIESRQAYQARKSLATLRTDRNDARGLAQLARPRFFKLVHVKSLPAHAIRALVIARKNWSDSASRSRTRSVSWPPCSESGCPRGLSLAFAKHAIEHAANAGTQRQRTTLGIRVAANDRYWLA
jgi:hypothetical protein